MFPSCAISWLSSQKLVYLKLTEENGPRRRHASHTVNTTFLYLGLVLKPMSRSFLGWYAFLQTLLFIILTDVVLPTSFSYFAVGASFNRKTNWWESIKQWKTVNQHEAKIYSFIFYCITWYFFFIRRVELVPEKREQSTHSFFLLESNKWNFM